MTKENYFKKVHAAMKAREQSSSLTLAETTRVCNLQKSGFSPVSVACVLIAARNGEQAA